MEVHAHTHTPRKKWTHYLWEFLMLFLAVFCGFLAENQREHLIEHKKEKSFVRSLWEDLQNDTARLNYSINRLKGDMRNADTLVRLYLKGIKDKAFDPGMAKYGMGAGFSVDVVFNDRTSSQLKSSGSMRMIRNKEVADLLLQYWNNQLRIEQIHNRYETIRIEQRKLGWKTFQWFPLNFQSYDSKDTSGFNLPPEVFADTPAGIINEQLLIEFMNVTANLFNTGLSQYLKDLQGERQLAQQLISLIENNYHLK